MSDSLQKIRDEIGGLSKEIERTGNLCWSPVRIEWADALRSVADRIDALLTESEAAVWRCNREGVPVEAECRPGCGCRDLPDSDKFYTTPQPQVPDECATFLKQLRDDLIMRSDVDGTVHLSGFLWEKLSAMIAAAQDGE